jgi:predicted porin
VTPNVSGLVVKAMYSLGENPAPGQGKVGNALGGSAQYDSGQLSLNLSYMNRTTTTANSDKWTARGASYDFSVVKAALVYQLRRDDAKLVRNDYFDLSATIPVTGGALLLDRAQRRQGALRRHRRGRGSNGRRGGRRPARARRRDSPLLLIAAAPFLTAGAACARRVEASRVNPMARQFEFA